MGRAVQLPADRSAQNNTQFRDDLFWLKGDHSFKFGADYQHLPYSGNFGQYVRGVVTGFTSGVDQRAR